MNVGAELCYKGRGKLAFGQRSPVRGVVCGSKATVLADVVKTLSWMVLVGAG